jgi:hypothetical protein
LDRLVVHPAFGGAEGLLLQARWASQRGAVEQARALTTEALTMSPGHPELHAFAAEIGAELPERARSVAARRLPA